MCSLLLPFWEHYLVLTFNIFYMDRRIHDIYTIIESIASVYDLDKTSLKEFIRDVKQCHALHMFLTEQLNKNK